MTTAHSPLFCQDGIDAAYPVTIQGPGADALFVSDNKYTGIFVIDKGVTASISGLTLTDSFTSTAAVVDYGSLNLSACTISGNTGVGHAGGPAGISPGGGRYVQGSASVTGSSITNNQAGGVYVSGTASISNCMIANNVGPRPGGEVGGDGAVTLTDCTITGNDGSWGANVYKAGTLTVIGCTITNEAGPFSINGGGVFEKGTGKLYNSTISGNSPDGEEGGLCNEGSLSVTECTISGNACSDGDGVFNKAGTATFTNCTITGNTAGQSGGNLYSEHGAKLTLYNTIVAGNTSGRSAADIGGPAADHVTGTYNLVGTGGSGGLANDGTNVLDVSDPGLATLGNHGGSTETFIHGDL